MKHILFLLIAAAAFVGCNKDDKGQLDPNAMISLRPEVTKAEGGNPEHLSALEIVKQTESIRFWHKPSLQDAPIGRGFIDKQRDIENLRLMMWGNDIINANGKLEPTFIDAVDLVFVRFDKPNNRIKDTVAYIPNRILREAAVQIRAAYNDEDYAHCYELFDAAYRFIPVTGAEWRALKAKGEN